MDVRWNRKNVFRPVKTFHRCTVNNLKLTCHLAAVFAGFVKSCFGRAVFLSEATRVSRSLHSCSCEGLYDRSCGAGTAPKNRASALLYSGIHARKFFAVFAYFGL